MASPECARAVDASFRHGTALVKYIAANEVGETGGKQRGYYLPVDDRVWPLFTPQSPVKGITHTHNVSVDWPGGLTTDSHVKWYGNKSRHEYRLTYFNKIRGFPFLDKSLLGAMLVLVVVEPQHRLEAHVLVEPEDVEDYLAAVGVSTARNWALFVKGREFSEEACVEQRFSSFVAAFDEFPIGDELSTAAIQALETCVATFAEQGPDSAIVKSINAEYALFRRLEKKLYEPALTKPFADIEAFLVKAQSILQRRKSRAGRSLENHVSYFLQRAGIPHEMRPKISGQPDVVIPSRECYLNRDWPDTKLFLVACKTTFKDRWGQVLKEGARVPDKHLLTLQKGMARTQLDEMRAANVTVVVPKEYMGGYPKSPNVMCIGEFFDKVGSALKS